MQLSPLNQRRWRNFKANRRAFWSLILFSILFVLSLFAEFLANDRPISDLIATRLSNTLFLAVYAAALSVPLSLILGILAALWRNSVFDRTVNALALTSISFPEFFVAYILIFVLAQSGFFPSMARMDP
ncbi:MAG: hypothetical protein ACK5IP_17985, partial [Paracoccus sp. (in: a-proteobacteria)]